MNVESIMVTKVVIARMDDTVRRLDGLFHKHKLRHLPVIDGGVIVGVISDRDLLRSISPYVGTVAEDGRDRETLNHKAHQIMTRNPITITPETPVDDAGQILLKHNVSCLPVLDDSGHVVGIITKKDILRALLALEADRI